MAKRKAEFVTYRKDIMGMSYLCRVEMTPIRKTREGGISDVRVSEIRVTAINDPQLARASNARDLQATILEWAQECLQASSRIPSQDSPS